jgi:molybdopterin biosynthesis enzyme
MSISVSVEQAVGMVLPHDITEIVKDKKKGVAFRKGHIIQHEDIAHLKRLGKDHIFVLELSKNDIHEDEAALLMAVALAGPGLEPPGNPAEGKIALKAALDGLLRINKNALFRFNMLGEVMCATLHDFTPVKKGETVAATRLIPLISTRKIVESAVEIATSDVTPIVQVLPLRKVKIGLVITGNEVFYGRIQDRFEEVLRAKVSALGSEVIEVHFAPDDKELIASAIGRCLQNGADFIVTSGGMSVDPDDVTREGIFLAGAQEVVYGTPVLPGAMFLCGYIGEKPILGVPACGMFHKVTVLDVIIPRILSGEKIDRSVIADLGHGGLCRNCTPCQYPACSFCK